MNNITLRTFRYVFHCCLRDTVHLEKRSQKSPSLDASLRDNQFRQTKFRNDFSETDYGAGVEAGRFFEVASNNSSKTEIPIVDFRERANRSASPSLPLLSRSWSGQVIHPEPDRNLERGCVRRCKRKPVCNPRGTHTPTSTALSRARSTSIPCHCAARPRSHANPA